MKNTLSQTEENYLKAIYHIQIQDVKNVSTTLIAKSLTTKASSVTDMLRKLADKKLVNYEKYKGVKLTTKGEKSAIKIVRKHRLWEVFLVEKLNYNWDEVHDIAEQLEHIKSDTLIDKLEGFLNFPTHDPHGDPIPDSKGKISTNQTILLSTAKQNVPYKIAKVKDNSSALLQFLDKNSLTIGSELLVIDQFEFDESITVKLATNHNLTFSKKTCENIFVTNK